MFPPPPFQFSLWGRSERDSFSILAFCKEEGEFFLIPESGSSGFVPALASRFNATMENVCADLGRTEWMRVFTTDSIDEVVQRYEEYITEYGVQGDEDDDDDDEIDQVGGGGAGGGAERGAGGGAG